jgi:hypothetical protein
MRVDPDEDYWFACASCRETHPLERKCWDAATVAIERCVACCGCLTHHGDPGGRVVWSKQHGWRGLHDSLWRTRRHQ